MSATYRPAYLGLDKIEKADRDKHTSLLIKT